MVLCEIDSSNMKVFLFGTRYLAQWMKKRFQCYRNAGILKESLRNEIIFYLKVQ
jgi:hypothetical protein